MPVRSMLGEHPGQGQLDVLEQHGRPAPVEVVVERAGQVGDRAGPHRLLLGDRRVGLVFAAVEGELALLVGSVPARSSSRR